MKKPQKKREAQLKKPSPHPETPQTVPQAAMGEAVLTQGVERAAAAGEVLNVGEFALTTYALAAGEARLVLPTTLAIWGPGQQVPASLGNGATTYNFAGGVVFGSPPVTR
jgi:hypothetical protein